MDIAICLCSRALVIEAAMPHRFSASASDLPCITLVKPVWSELMGVSPKWSIRFRFGRDGHLCLPPSRSSFWAGNLEVQGNRPRGVLFKVGVLSVRPVCRGGCVRKQGAESGAGEGRWILPTDHLVRLPH